MSLALEESIEGQISGTKEAGHKKDKDEKAKLSDIVELLNDRFGTDFTEADKLFFDQVEQELVEDSNLNEQAKSNTIDNFKFGFEDAFLTKIIERMEQNQDIFGRIKREF